MHSFKLLHVCLIISLSITLIKSAHISVADDDLLDSLYTSKDDIDILTAKNFVENVSGKPYAWIVEFYNHWCGFCQRYAPIYKALATDIKSWRDLIHVGAIDCAHESNQQICKDFEIIAYPSLRYFHENYQIDSNNTGSNVTKGDDLLTNRNNLIRQMIGKQAEGKGQMYPDLQPYIYPDTTTLLSNFIDGQVKYIFLVVEQFDNFFGAALALDLHKATDIVIRYSFSKNTALVKNLQVTEFPFVIAFANDNSTQTFSHNINDKNALKSTIISFLQSQKFKLPPEITEHTKEVTTTEISTHHDDDALLHEIKNLGDVVFKEDLETALRYSLKNEILRLKTVRGEKLDALTAYLKILIKYFPFGPEGTNFLRQLNDTISNMTKNNVPINRNVLLQIVNNAENKESGVYIPIHHEWLACRGSTASRRGYPCGLWKLFHYLTVNANSESDPLEVLNAMHGYIKNFFGCADCSQHFQEMAVLRGMSNVSSLNSSIIWLWAAHNQVNTRLAGDETEDPEFPKTQYPLKERCPPCRNSDDSWNVSEVLKYLKRVYNKDNLISFEAITSGTGQFSLSMTLIYFPVMFYLFY